MADSRLKRYIRRVTRHPQEQDLLSSRLKHLVADLFRMDIAEPDTISDHAPLLGGELGLDSFDALELTIYIEEEFGLTFQSEEDSYRALTNISSLASFIQSHARITPARRRSPVGNRIFGQRLTALSLG